MTIKMNMKLAQLIEKGACVNTVRNMLGLNSEPPLNADVEMLCREIRGESRKE